MRSPSLGASMLLVSMLLVGCSGIELDSANPSGVALSGEWTLDAAASDPTPDLRPGQRRRARGSSDQRVLQRREILGAAGSEIAFIVHDFQVLSAERLRIELNRDSMGIAYEPGVYRDVSWGERQRGLWETYAGWEARDLVIVSRANDMRVMERMQQLGNTLTVTVTLDADGREQVIRRVFTR